MERRADLLARRITAQHQHRPGEDVGGMIGVGTGARRDQLHDVAPLVLSPRVRRMQVVGLALLVLGHDAIDLTGDRRHFDVLWPVHRCCPELVGGSTGVDQHRRLVGEAVLGGQRALPLDQRQPCHLAVGVELRDRQGALVEEVHVGLAVSGVDGAFGDEPVDVLEIIIVAEIDDHASVLVGDDRRAFVAEAAERGALHRHGVRVIGVDLDHPLEAVELVRLLLDVEAVVEAGEAVVILVAVADPLVAVFDRRLGRIAAEERGRPLLAGEHGAPRGDATGAVGRGADHLGSCRIG